VFAPTQFSPGTRVFFVFMVVPSPGKAHCFSHFPIFVADTTTRSPDRWDEAARVCIAFS
jgi:hypothetical protein